MRRKFWVKIIAHYNFSQRNCVQGGARPFLDLPQRGQGSALPLKPQPGNGPTLNFRSSHMAQTSINIQPVKSGSEKHNERLKEMEHIRKDLSHLNQSWKSPDFPTINEQLAAIRADYQVAHGKKLHAKATPIREAVVVIQEGTSLEQLRSACEECRRRYGIQAMQIYTHLDEGYAHAKEWTPNRHAHIVFNWYDFDKHATCKLNKYDTMELQTIFARHLKMERGVSSDRKHLNAIQQKNKAESVRLQHLQEQVQQQNENARNSISLIQKAVEMLIAMFDWLAKLVEPKKEELEHRHYAEKIAKQDIDKISDLPTFSETLQAIAYKFFDIIEAMYQRCEEPHRKKAESGLFVTMFKKTKELFKLNTKPQETPNNAQEWLDSVDFQKIGKHAADEKKKRTQEASTKQAPAATTTPPQFKSPKR